MFDFDGCNNGKKKLVSMQMMYQGASLPLPPLCLCPCCGIFTQTARRVWYRRSSRVEPQWDSDIRFLRLYELTLGWLKNPEEVVSMAHLLLAGQMTNPLPHV